MRLTVTVVWNLFLAAVAFIPVIVAPAIFPPVMGLFGIAFIGFAMHAIWSR